MPPVVVDRQNLEREVASLEQALAQAEEDSATAEHALDELDGLRGEAAGRLEIARQAAGSYAARLEERREDLQRAVEAELHTRTLDAVAARDEAALRAAEAIANVFAAFEQLETARAATADRLAELEAHVRSRIELDPEPGELDEQWAQLVDFVKRQAELRLDEELVEAALSSPLGHEIEKLPEHLQVVARHRRQERRRAARPSRNKKG
jgi:chromosome segregation ATPase